MEIEYNSYHLQFLKTINLYSASKRYESLCIETKFIIGNTGIPKLEIRKSDFRNLIFEALAETRNTDIYFEDLNSNYGNPNPVIRILIY